MSDNGKRDQWQEWLKEFQNESDRACALLGTSFLDEQLKGLLESFLIDDKKIKELFSGYGPLASFSSRINMAYALGFLSKTEFSDLELIRKIRNEFAHELHGLQFSSNSIKNRCSELKSCDAINDYYNDLPPRGRFILSVVIIANWVKIRRLGILDNRRKVQVEIKIANNLT